MQSRVRLINRTVSLTRLLLVVALIMLGSMVPQMAAAQASPMAGHAMSQHDMGGTADHGAGHGAGKSHGLACDIACIGVTVPGMAALVPGVYLRGVDIRLPIAVARLTGREPAPPMHPPKPDLFG